MTILHDSELWRPILWYGLWGLLYCYSATRPFTIQLLRNSKSPEYWYMFYLPCVAFHCACVGIGFSLREHGDTSPVLFAGRFTYYLVYLSVGYPLALVAVRIAQRSSTRAPAASQGVVFPSDRLAAEIVEVTYPPQSWGRLLMTALVAVVVGLAVRVLLNAL